jgi:hypothetical protein
VHPKNISQDAVHDFLWYLLRHLRGHVIVVWDGTRIHDPIFGCLRVEIPIQVHLGFEAPLDVKVVYGERIRLNLQRSSHSRRVV